MKAPPGPDIRLRDACSRMRAQLTGLPFTLSEELLLRLARAALEGLPERSGTGVRIHARGSVSTARGKRVGGWAYAVVDGVHVIREDRGRVVSENATVPEMEVEALTLALAGEAPGTVAVVPAAGTVGEQWLFENHRVRRRDMRPRVAAMRDAAARLTLSRGHPTGEDRTASAACMEAARKACREGIGDPTEEGTAETEDADVEGT